MTEGPLCLQRQRLHSPHCLPFSRGRSAAAVCHGRCRGQGLHSEAAGGKKGIAMSSTAERAEVLIDCEPSVEMLSSWEGWILFVLAPPPPSPNLLPLPCSSAIKPVRMYRDSYRSWRTWMLVLKLAGQKKPGKYSRKRKSLHLCEATHAQSLAGKLRRCLLVHVGEESVSFPGGFV